MVKSSDVLGGVWGCGLLYVIGTPSKLNVTRKPVVLESQDNPFFELLSERHVVVAGRVDVVHYSSIKGELKTRSIYECRCDERLKPKGEESTCLTYNFIQWVFWKFFFSWVARVAGLQKGKFSAFTLPLEQKKKRYVRDRRKWPTSGMR